MTDEEHRPLPEEGPLSPGFEMHYGTLRGQQGERGEQGEQGAEGPPLTRRKAWSVVYLFGLAVLLSVISLYWTNHQVNASDHRWCATIDTLDNADQAAEHAPAAERPKGAYSFALIRDFHQLRQSLGCG
jgi:hypothetical protein